MTLYYEHPEDEVIDAGILLGGGAFVQQTAEHLHHCRIQLDPGDPHLEVMEQIAAISGRGHLPMPKHSVPFLDSDWPGVQETVQKWIRFFEKFPAKRV